MFNRSGQLFSNYDYYFFLMCIAAVESEEKKKSPNFITLAIGRKKLTKRVCHKTRVNVVENVCCCRRTTLTCCLPLTATSCQRKNIKQNAVLILWELS